ncbi:hypothetical protein KR018_002742 [Drosophila ironensis]|nr:hypothetical protein KR018_002742 [Drosophila ironensis]
MLSVAQWLATFSAGIVITSQTMRMLHTVNDREQEDKMYGNLQTAAIAKPEEPEEPQNLGSEQLSNALQHILSSDTNSSHVYIDAMHNDTARDKQDYALGSESLNRVLEDIMTPSGGESSSSLAFEPAAEV